MTPRQPCNLLVASCDRGAAGGGGIYGFSLTETGEIRRRSFTPADRPMYLAREGGYLYALLRAPFADSSESGLVRFDITDGLSLENPTPTVSTGGEVACHLCVKNGDVYAANYISGSISLVGQRTVQHVGSGPDKIRQSAAHAHFVTFTPDGETLCAVDLGADKLFLYDRALQPKGFVSLPAGSGPRHLVFSTDGRYCFVASELANTVTCFAYREGRFTLTDTVSCLPEGCSTPSAAAAIRLLGDKIAVSNRGADCLSVLRHRDGRLTLCDTVPTGGACPRDFAVGPGILAVANEESDLVTLLDEDLQPVGCIPDIPSPVSVLFV